MILCVYESSPPQLCCAWCCLCYYKRRLGADCRSKPFHTLAALNEIILWWWWLVVASMLSYHLTTHQQLTVNWGWSVSSRSRTILWTKRLRGKVERAPLCSLNGEIYLHAGCPLNLINLNVRIWREIEWKDLSRWIEIMDSFCCRLSEPAPASRRAPPNKLLCTQRWEGWLN